MSLADYRDSLCGQAFSPIDRDFVVCYKVTPGPWRIDIVASFEPNVTMLHWVKTTEWGFSVGTIERTPNARSAAGTGRQRQSLTSKSQLL